MKLPSVDLRQRLVDAYESKQSGNYEKTADLFGVGEATVSRTLRRYRETGSVEYKPRPANNPRRIDLTWLRAHLEANPDARAVDRIAAWEQHSGVHISETAMYDAMAACGWTHKKRRSSRASVTGPTSKPSG